MRMGMTRLVAAAGLLASLAMAGCLAPPRHPIVGTALELYGADERRVGELYREFAFTRPDGTLTRLSAVRGRVTVLAFPDERDWPNEAAAEALADAAARESTWDIPVVVVSVGRPAEACEAALARGAAYAVPPGRLVLVCDPFAAVDKAYGPEAVGRYYVLTNFLKIAAIGALSDLESLRRDVGAVVDAIHDQDLREGRYDWYSSCD